MRRVPVIPTLLTLVMLAVLVSLGVWQLQRREWKHALIARAEAAPKLPPLEPRDYYRSLIGAQSVQYRRAILPCSPGKVLPYDLKGGTSATTGDSGYLILVSCRPNTQAARNRRRRRLDTAARCRSRADHRRYGHSTASSSNVPMATRLPARSSC